MRNVFVWAVMCILFMPVVYGIDLSLSSTSPSSGSVVVHAAITNEQPVGGLLFEIPYDPALVSAPSREQIVLEGRAKQCIMSADTSKDVVTVGLVCIPHTISTGDGDVVSITFPVVSGGNAEFNVAGVQVSDVQGNLLSVDVATGTNAYVRGGAAPTARATSPVLPARTAPTVPSRPAAPQTADIEFHTQTQPERQAQVQQPAATPQPRITRNPAPEETTNIWPAVIGFVIVMMVVVIGVAGRKKKIVQEPVAPQPRVVSARVNKPASKPVQKAQQMRPAKPKHSLSEVDEKLRKIDALLGKR